MADQKITQFTALASVTADDIFPVVNDPDGSPANRKISVLNLFKAIPSNTVVNGTFTGNANNTLNGSNTVVSSNVNMTSVRPPRVTAKGVTIMGKSTVTSNNATTQLGSGGMQGTLFWDENYIYVATSNTVVKRVALSLFAS